MGSIKKKMSLMLAKNVELNRKSVHMKKSWDQVNKMINNNDDKTKKTGK